MKGVSEMSEHVIEKLASKAIRLSNENDICLTEASARVVMSTGYGLETMEKMAKVLVARVNHLKFASLREVNPIAQFPIAESDEVIRMLNIEDSDPMPADSSNVIEFKSFEPDYGFDDVKVVKVATEQGALSELDYMQPELMQYLEETAGEMGDEEASMNEAQQMIEEEIIALLNQGESIDDIRISLASELGEQNIGLIDELISGVIEEAQGEGMVNSELSVPPELPDYLGMRIPEESALRKSASLAVKHENNLSHLKKIALSIYESISDEAFKNNYKELLGV